MILHLKSFRLFKRDPDSCPKGNNIPSSSMWVVQNGASQYDNIKLLWLLQGAQLLVAPSHWWSCSTLPRSQCSLSYLILKCFDNNKIVKIIAGNFQLETRFSKASCVQPWLILLRCLQKAQISQCKSQNKALSLYKYTCLSTGVPIHRGHSFSAGRMTSPRQSQKKLAVWGMGQHTRIFG